MVVIKAFDQGSGGFLMRMTPGRFDSTCPSGRFRGPVEVVVIDKFEKPTLD